MSQPDPGQKGSPAARSLSRSTPGTRGDRDDREAKDENLRAPTSPASKANGVSAGKERAGLERALARAEGTRWRRRLAIALGLAILVAGFFVYRAKTRVPPPARYVTADLSRGDVIETVQSTGQVTPTTQVQVGAQVSGRVTKVFVDFNSQVKKGDVLCEIDPLLFNAQIDSTQAQIAAAAANVVRSEATLATTKHQLDRAHKVVAEGIGSQADLDAAQGAYDVAVADVTASKANVSQLYAQLRSSKTNLDYTRIFSPINGIVVNRAIDPGQTVAASFQAPVLFVIAEDLSKMRVLADIDEADVGKLKEGMNAEISVDAFIGDTFKGTVSQVRYSANNVSGVVTYAAVIEVENPELKLRPGMTATVTIHTNEVKDSLRVPNSALRFKPSPPTDKDGKAIPQPPQPPLPPHNGRVYVITDATLGAEKIEPRVVTVGVTDGVNTVTTTDLGAVKVVTDETDDTTKKSKGPRMF